MNAKHLVTHFAAPVFFYLGFVLFFVAGMCVLAFMSKDPSFLVMGLIMFILGYNSWSFAKLCRENKSS